MKVRVLGSAAGGGFPQWNCNCANCNGVRNGTIKARTRTQSSLAVIAPNRQWVLVNATPDIREQMSRQVDLLGPAPRQTNLQAVMLLDSQMDHAGGLPLLRESSEPLQIFGTSSVHEDLSQHYPVLRLLESYCGYCWHAWQDEPITVDGLPDLEFLGISVPGKAPPYSPHRGNEQGGESLAVRIINKTTGRSLLYAPSVDTWTDELEHHASESQILLVEGTCWLDDDLQRAGCRDKTGTEMGHCYLNGEHGLLEILRRFPDKERYLIHINNTNPVLNEESEAFHACLEAGVHLAFDDLEFDL